MRSLAEVIILLAVLNDVRCHRYYQKRIPNGHRVPHPCELDGTWQGVGHRNQGGGGLRNPFGQDFAKNDHKWDVTLCQRDSDNDGVTNGEELGDPDCKWTEGDPHPSYGVISHPGICDPWNSAKCEEVNKWLNCGETEFKCEELNREDIEVKNLTLRLKKTKVPPKETTYMCQIFDLPDVTQNFHVIADQVYVDNSHVAHHVLLYGCSSTDTVDGTFYKPFECGMGAGNNCDHLIGLWTVGLYGTCHNPAAGFLIGLDGFKRVAIELHWNNPERKLDYFDSSGMTIYYTPNLRPNNAGVLQIGQLSLTLPPNKDRIVTEVVCPKECLTTRMNGPIYLTNGINHMHYLGKSQYVQQYRNGTLKSQLTREPIYNYDSPQLVTYNPVKELRPEDEIRSVCEFRTTSRNTSTFFGLQTSDEMCFVFFWYFPKENMPYSFCQSYRSIPYCKLYGEYAKQHPVIQGCDFQAFFTQEKIHYYTYLITNNCKPFECLDECLDTVQKLKKDPCFQGDIFLVIQKRLMSQSNGFFIVMLFHSCDSRIGQMENAAQTTVTPLRIESSVGVRTFPNDKVTFLFSIYMYVSVSWCFF